MLGLGIATAVFLGLAVFLRWFGSRENPTIVVVQPANTTAVMLLKSNTVTRDKDGKVTGVNNDGGDIVDLIHTAPGRKLKKPGHDPMNWELSPGKEKRSLLYLLTSIRMIGVFRYLRINDVRTFRWGRKDDQDKYSVMPKTSITRFPHFQGQHDIELKGVETKEIIKFDLRLNLTTEEKFPVRVRYRTADAYAQLTTIVSDHVIDKIGAVDPKEFIEGTPEGQQTSKGNLKQQLTDSFKKKDIQDLIEQETGLHVREANLPDFDFDEATRKLLEANTKALLEGEAGVTAAKKLAEQTVITAAAANKAQMLRNKGDADRIEKVIKPAAENELTVRVVEAEAYRDNKVVTTSVRGGGVVLPVAGK